MHIKNTHTRIKFLLVLVCFILSFTEHAYFSMRIFYARQRIRHGHGMRIFQAFMKFWLYDVKRLHDIVVALHACETFSLGSILNKIENSNFDTKVYFFAINFGI